MEEVPVEPQNQDQDVKENGPADNNIAEEPQNIKFTEIKLSEDIEKPAVDCDNDGGGSKMNLGNNECSVTTSDDNSASPKTVIDEDSSPSSNKGSETYLGPSSVAQNGYGDTVGSRLAAPDVTAGSQSSSDPNRSPIFTPNPSSTNLDKSTKNVKLGFGNTAVQPKLSSLTLHDFQHAAAGKAEQVKSWSVRAFKCTKQVLSEKLGKGQRTVDLELEAKIEILRDTKRKYENLLALSRLLGRHFTSIICTQQALGTALAELSAKSQELQGEFRCNAEAQLVIAKNGEKLVETINAFVVGVETLCSKTMEDTLITVNKYETARLAYDAYKNELTALSLRPRTANVTSKQAVAQAKFETNKRIYEQLRDDVEIKLRFLGENRVKVMQKHLLLFHRAICAYFSGNQEELEDALKQYNINRAGPDVVITSQSED